MTGTWLRESICNITEMHSSQVQIANRTFYDRTWFRELTCCLTHCRIVRCRSHTNFPWPEHGGNWFAVHRTAEHSNEFTHRTSREQEHDSENYFAVYRTAKQWKTDHRNFHDHNMIQRKVGLGFCVILHSLIPASCVNFDAALKSTF